MAAGHQVQRHDIAALRHAPQVVIGAAGARTRAACGRAMYLCLPSPVLLELPLERFNSKYAFIPTNPSIAMASQRCGEGPLRRLPLASFTIGSAALWEAIESIDSDAVAESAARDSVSFWGTRQHPWQAVPCWNSAQPLNPPSCAACCLSGDSLEKVQVSSCLLCIPYDTDAQMSVWRHRLYRLAVSPARARVFRSREHRRSRADEKDCADHRPCTRSNVHPFLYVLPACAAA